jgi:ADP-ribosylation factor-like protein 2
MGASLLVFLNKTDVEHCMSEEEVRQVRDLLIFPRSPVSYDSRLMNLRGQRLGLDLIKTHTWTILPCSAITGKNLNEGLDWVVHDAQDRLFLY